MSAKHLWSTVDRCSFEVKRFDLELISLLRRIGWWTLEGVQRMEADHVDEILEQWAAEWPGLDVSPQGIVGRVSRLSRFLERDIVDIFEQFGLTGGEFDVLATLRRTVRTGKALTPTDLAATCMLSSAAMTNRIDRLEEAGLVTRERDGVDRRAVLVRLSPDGRALIDRALVVHLSNEAEMISVLTPGDQRVLADLLRRLLVPIERRRRPGSGKQDQVGRRPSGVRVEPAVSA